MSIGPETHAWRRRLTHLQRMERQYFVTFVTRGRRVLEPEGRTIVLDTIVAGHSISYALDSLVVMPDHVHQVLTPYRHTTLPKIVKFIKSVSTKKMRQGAMWQREYFDRIVRRDEDLRRLGEYVVNNPVRAGLVDRAEDYPWIWRAWIEGAK